MSFTPLPHRFRKACAEQAGSVLLESSKRDPGAQSLLFTEPLRVLRALRPEDVLPALQAADEAVREGLYVAGYVAYEAGFALEPKAGRAESDGSTPLVWLGIYREPQIFDHSQIAEKPAAIPSGPVCEAFELSSDVDRYRDDLEQIRTLIEAGDCYQANLTMEASWKNALPADEVMARMMHAQPVAFGAMLNLGEVQIVSASPELFFQREGERVTTQPMKGTAARGNTNAEDEAAMQALAQDEKNRAENLMIVDLLRNDLGRICTAGSVLVTKLFEVARFPTVLQMTSTIEGTLLPGTSYTDIFRALFPCGSIVGAPKIRTMQILRKMEARKRGVYTGCIGYISPKGTAAFSVAIRTAVLEGESARIGVGSGIVYDSDAASEYDECATKLRFLTEAPDDFGLIETMLWEDGFPFLEQHLGRLADSARYFDWELNQQAIEDSLLAEAQKFTSGERWRVRLVFRPSFIEVSSTALGPRVEEEVTLLLAERRMISSDRFLRHKTTKRAIYDLMLAHAQTLGYADAIFQNERNELTEGCIHTLVLRIGEAWLTPPIACGALPGVFRDHMLRTRTAMREQVLMLEDLLRADEVYVCNAVRGMRRVRGVVDETGKVLRGA